MGRRGELQKATKIYGSSKSRMRGVTFQYAVYKNLTKEITIDNGYPLIWMRFSTFVFLLCKIR